MRGTPTITVFACPAAKPNTTLSAADRRNGPRASAVAITQHSATAAK